MSTLPKKLKHIASAFILMFISLPLFAQEATTVFGQWNAYKDNGAGIVVDLHSSSQKGNFIYKESKECYGGIAISNEYFEYTDYYIFNDISGENDKVEIAFTREDANGKKISEGTLTATLAFGNLVLENDKMVDGYILNVTKVYPNENIADSDSGITLQDVTDFLLGLLIIAVLFGAMGHMIYILTRPKHFPQAFTVEDFKEKRLLAGMQAEATEEENANAADILEHSFDSWVSFTNDDGEEDKAATKKKMVDETEACLSKAIEIMPTDPEVVDYLNAVGESVNIQWARKFSGNKILIGVCVAIMVLMIFTAGWQAVPFFIFSLALYILSCYKPTFMHNKDIFKDSKSFSYGCLASIFGFIASAQTVRTVTKWSDGTKTVDDDYSQHWIHLALGIIVLVIIGIFLFVWALINYLRNYILYW